MRLHKHRHERIFVGTYLSPNMYRSLALRKTARPRKRAMPSYQGQADFPKLREQVQTVTKDGRWMNGEGRGCVRLGKFRSELALSTQRGTLWGRSAFKPTGQHVGKPPRADISLSSAFFRKTGELASDLGVCQSLSVPEGI